MGDYPSQSPFQLEPALAGRLAAAKEAVWFRIGVLQSTMNDRERALEAFERVLSVNPSNVRAMTQAGAVLAKKECYPQAVSYLQRAISADSTCGEAWAVLAHCYVMTDDLQKAYQAYQSALSHLPNPRDPNLWYGIGLLYDRYGSLDNALEAFLAVLSISPDFERADEVCFCIGIIYKEQQNFDEALKYFNKVVVAANPPPPLTRADGWYQIGHVNELKRDIPVALEMYKHALAENPKHPKTLQNFGWLEHQHNNNSSEAIRLLKMSADLDASDGQTWYLLGRVYMALREFRQAYDAYQQAVYRDGRNATFWCSIGVLYYQMNQYRDAMDAYSRAIRLNPYVSEVWYDLGTLYESCGQNADAIDAYRRAAELAPENTQITARLGVLENSMNPGAHQQQSVPQPQHSAQQGQAQQMPPQQMQPEMHHPSPHMQSQLNSVGNRPMGPPLQQLTQPLTQQKLPHHQSPLTPSQLPTAQPGPHPTSMPQGAGDNVGSMSGPQRSGQMEVSSIAALRNHSLPHSQGLGQNGAFSQDGRPSLPATLAPVHHGGNSAGMNHLSPMMSQPLNSQPHSAMVSGPSMNASQPDSMQNYHQRPGTSPHAQLPGLAHRPGSQEPQRHHSQLGHPDGQQQGQHLSGPMAHIPPMQPMQPGQGQTQGQSDTQQPPQQQQQEHVPHSQSKSQSSPHPSQEPQQHGQQQAQGSQQQAHTTPQASPPSQGLPAHHGPHTQANGSPTIQPLSHLQGLPQMQSQQPDHGKRSSPQARPVNGPDGPMRVVGKEQENGREQFMHGQGEGLRQPDFPRGEERHDGQIPKLQKPEGRDTSMGFHSGQETNMTSQPIYSSTSNAIPHGSSAPNAIPSIRDPGTDAATSGPLPPRSMSMHEITQQDSHPPQRRMEGDNREGNDRTGPDSHPQGSHQGPEKGQPDRLPAMSSLSGPMPVNSVNRESMTSAPMPSLPLPVSSLAQPSGGGDAAKSSSPHAPLDPATSSGVSGGAPPLPPMSSRTPSSLGGIGKENKDSSGIVTPGLGVSSLTKFGQGLVRGPATPVNNSVAPSSLPSPLPTRKNSGSGSVVRSPRIAKPAAPPSFKSVSMPPPANQGGQIESVPSPSSLPVLPALSSHGNHDNDKQMKDKSNEQDAGTEGAEADSRIPGPKHDERSNKESNGARKSDDPMLNKPIFGVLRSAPAPVQTTELNRSEKEDKVKSPVSSQRQEGDASSLKREGPSKEESGRTAKRPRLNDLHDGDEQKSYAHDGDDKQQKGGNKGESDRKEGDSLKSGRPSGGRTEIPSYKEIKADLRSGNATQGAGTEDSKGETQNRSEVEDGKGIGLGSQVIDLPLLSTPMSRSGPSLAGNTPLPSFRGERMKSAQDSSSRSSLPFPLRSAPVTSLPAPLKSHIPAGNRGMERDYGTSQGEEGVKRVSEDKAEGGASSREEMGERVANGEAEKASENKDEKQTRSELHSSAT